MVYANVFAWTCIYRRKYSREENRKENKYGNTNARRNSGESPDFGEIRRRAAGEYNDFL